jgi:hypothetical protein
MLEQRMTGWLNTCDVDPDLHGFETTSIPVTSVSDPCPKPDPHSIGSWIRIQKGENQPQKKKKNQV